MNNETIDLDRALQEWTAVPFPDDSDDDELSDIHADLVLYDSDVVGYVTSLLGGVTKPQSLLSDDYGLEQRLQSILASNVVSRHKEAEAYYAYFSGLRRLVALARQYVSA